jgi:hypothetical protein
LANSLLGYAGPIPKRRSPVTNFASIGYTATTAQLLSVPPYAAAALVTITVGYIADRTKKRGLCNIFTSVFAIVGFSMLLGAKSPGVQYAATYLAAIGIYPPIANTLSWVSNNTEGKEQIPLRSVSSAANWSYPGVYKRGITLGFVIGWGNLNGIVASNIYRGVDKPRFIPGNSVVLAYLVVFLFGGSLIQHVLLILENRKRSAGRRNGWLELDEAQLKIRGDKRPDFLYIE